MSESTEMTIARYVVAGLPIPENLMEKLVLEACNAYNEEKTGLKPKATDSPVA